MKVISGSLKGRTVLGHDLVGTRPTMDRVKESIFGMIQNKVKDAIVLDLFAGTGNLGIESISNGSKLCYFVDKSPFACKTIKKNVNTFKIDDKSFILNMDYVKALSYFFEENKIMFDIVFLDPPYKEQILVGVLNSLIDMNLLNNGSLVIMEMEDNYIGTLDVPGVHLIKNKKYGSKYVNIYERQG